MSTTRSLCWFPRFYSRRVYNQTGSLFFPLLALCVTNTIVRNKYARKKRENEKKEIKRERKKEADDLLAPAGPSSESLSHSS